MKRLDIRDPNMYLVHSGKNTVSLKVLLCVDAAYISQDFGVATIKI